MARGKGPKRWGGEAKNIQKEIRCSISLYQRLTPSLSMLDHKQVLRTKMKKKQSMAMAKASAYELFSLCTQRLHKGKEICGFLQSTLQTQNKNYKSRGFVCGADQSEREDNMTPAWVQCPLQL